MKNLTAILFILGLTALGWAFAKEGTKENGGHEHAHDEGGASVGPEKGILAASEEEGIQLSPEATKNFELQFAKLEGSGPWNIPESAHLFAGEEVNLFRFRNGFYKRVDFNVVNRSGSRITVTSNELKPGDAIVIQGIGFLRIAEISAFGGTPEGHSH